MFDVSSLAFRDQFEASVIVSGVLLAAAVVLREWFTDREIRIIARVLGLAGWAVVVIFGWRMTLTNETLAMQVAQKPVKASSITEQYLSAVSFKTPKGRTINWENDKNAGSASMPDFSRRSRCSSSRFSDTACRDGRFDGRTDGSRPIGDRPNGSPSKLLARKPDESIHADDGPEQF